jgi:hypothetical protein
MYVKAVFFPAYIALSVFRMMEEASKYNVARFNALYVILCDVIMFCSFHTVYLIFLNEMNGDHGSLKKKSSCVFCR